MSTPPFSDTSARRASRPHTFPRTYPHEGSPHVRSSGRHESAATRSQITSPTSRELALRQRLFAAICTDQSVPDMRRLTPAPTAGHPSADVRAPPYAPSSLSKHQSSLPTRPVAYYPSPSSIPTLPTLPPRTPGPVFSSQHQLGAEIKRMYDTRTSCQFRCVAHGESDFFFLAPEDGYPGLYSISHKDCRMWLDTYSDRSVEDLRCDTQTVAQEQKYKHRYECGVVVFPDGRECGAILFFQLVLRQR
ncbi:hypothetical protein FA95DRAFT_1553936 [Auriscalpium vulgare]|uniref:Uncharacterized protein n=1 Tax=Auriscalpium vulgare TaxID=40419 RepID=A0ACB8S7P6_9AGAM|nr:hypothetical protein FA95DRAFT_1553936 [Auriscalpium vulgare]